MKIEIKNVVKLFAFLVCLLPVWTWAASYEVPTSTSIVDGDTFCGGAACTSADTIIIKGGARGSLKFQDFNGSGSYITITNENTDPDSKVEITGNGADGSIKILSLYNCKYVDLGGNNDSDITYGIKVINDGTPTCGGTVWVYGESDHIKLSYLEVAFDGNTTVYGIGIQVQDVDLTTAWTFDTFEIHHNYIHDSKYCGMYLGHNNPDVDDNPYVRAFSVHDNIMENLGSYGITYKGINGPNNYIYNNKVTITGVVPGTLTDDFFHGIGVHHTYGGNYVEIYNNWIEKTVGPGLYIGGNKHLVYNNVIAGCGSGNHKYWGHGIITDEKADGVDIYANTIIQAQRYAMYGVSTESVTHRKNIIGGSGIGEAGGSNLTEGTGDQANTYESDVSNLNFKIWSDDGDYSNDDFSFSIKAPTMLSVQGTP